MVGMFHCHSLFFWGVYLNRKKAPTDGYVIFNYFRVSGLVNLLEFAQISGRNGVQI